MQLVCECWVCVLSVYDLLMVGEMRLLMWVGAWLGAAPYQHAAHAQFSILVDINGCYKMIVKLTSLYTNCET